MRNTKSSPLNRDYPQKQTMTLKLLYKFKNKRRQQKIRNKVQFDTSTIPISNIILKQSTVINTNTAINMRVHPVMHIFFDFL